MALLFTHSLTNVANTTKDLRGRLGLADYSASQTSLEQIFLRYANDDVGVHGVHADGPVELLRGDRRISVPIRPEVARFDTRTGQLIGTTPTIQG